MGKFPATLATCAALVCAARAEAPSKGIAESTDPARAAAVERAARDIQARASRDAPAGKTAGAIVRGETAAGAAFLSGGITVGDRDAMHAERERYDLWVATVAKPSGAYLTDARLRIVDARTRSVVLERTMDGPWFMIALPAGRYDVVATYASADSAPPQTLTTRVEVPSGGMRQAVLRFDSPATVAPEAQDPFNGNPFGAAAKR